MSFVRKNIWGGVLITSFLAGTAFAQADNNNKIPAGHSYSPSQQRLPLLNSRRDRVNSRADVFEAEINRSKRDTAVTFGNMRIFGRDRHLRGGSSNRPLY